MRPRRAALVPLVLLGLIAPPASRAQGSAYTPPPENLAARAWFQDAKFGLFVHWGVYSVLGDGEWVMNNKKIRVAEYEKLPAFFNPVAFDPAEWVALVKAAGMKYVTITSKHHDGFAMWDSKVSDWDVGDRTPYKKDILKMLADECRKQGVKLFFYHSQLDWHHPDYYPRGRTGRDTARSDSGEWLRYLDYMDAQLEELLTGYGPVGGTGSTDGGTGRTRTGGSRRRTRSSTGCSPPPSSAATTTGSPSPGKTSRCSRRTFPARRRRASTSSPRSATCPSRCARR
jgi:alpha-L-fucosidase